MVNKVFSIKDSKADFWPPKVYVNEPSAVREFAMVVNEPGNIVSFAPGDFQLFQIGEFDTEDGKLSRLAVPKLCANGADLVGVMNEK